MTILCGTDLSENAGLALNAAAHLALRTQLPLHVAFSLELSPEPDPKRERAQWAAQLLEREAERLRALGATVTPHVIAGPPDEALIELTSTVSAQLVVVGALGHRRPGSWTLGSHADRLAQRSKVPVIVVRDSEPFRAWAKQERPLRVLLGADASLSTEAALHFIEQLRGFGPCEVTAVSLFWPPEQFRRLGFGGARSYVDVDPSVRNALTEELAERLGSEAGPIRVRVEPNLGSVGERLAWLAIEEGADLIVVGTHSRSALGRLWEGSVSRGALHHASCSVACVPLRAQQRALVTPQLRSALAATDFSPTGDAAIPLAYSMIEPGGTVHLVHVISGRERHPLDPHDIFELDDANVPYDPRDRALKRLQARLPEDARERQKHTHLHVLESSNAAEAICQAAERLRVDVLSIGTHGRSGVQRALLGSVASTVVETTTRPVLLARKPRE